MQLGGLGASPRPSKKSGFDQTHKPISVCVGLLGAHRFGGTVILCVQLDGHPMEGFRAVVTAFSGGTQDPEREDGRLAFELAHFDRQQHNLKALLHVGASSSFRALLRRQGFEPVDTAIRKELEVVWRRRQGREFDLNIDLVLCYQRDDLSCDRGFDSGLGGLFRKEQPGSQRERHQASHQPDGYANKREFVRREERCFHRGAPLSVWFVVTCG